MNLFRIFNRGGTAPVARERLQILLAHERTAASKQDLLAILHKEVLAAISKHVAVEPDKVEVKVHRRDEMSVLEIGIEIDGEAMTIPAPLADDRAA
jgi:cell division topological specificity factor